MFHKTRRLNLKPDKFKIKSTLLNIEYICMFSITKEYFSCTAVSALYTLLFQAMRSILATLQVEVQNYIKLSITKQ